jgi:hypothetical protein
MSDFLEGKAARKIVNGLLVEKGATAIAGAGTIKGLFNVVGGRVIIKTLLGEVTTGFEAKANACKFQFTPTGGAAVDLSAAVECNGDVAGTLYGITGLPATAMSVTIGNAVNSAYDVVLKPGVVGFHTAADATGALKASVVYVPLDDGAYVAAV